MKIAALNACKKLFADRDKSDPIFLPNNSY